MCLIIIVYLYFSGGGGGVLLFREAFHHNFMVFTILWCLKRIFLLYLALIMTTVN